MRGNWNDQITIQLNEKGLKIYKDYYKGLNLDCPKLDGNQLKIQLWGAACIFGRYLSIGFELPFEDSYFEITSCLRGKISKAYKVIETDNFGRDYPGEKFATPYEFTREDAVGIANWFNETMGGVNAQRYWKAVPSDYQLQPGQEELVRVADYAENPRCPHCGSEKLDRAWEVTFRHSSISNVVTCEGCGMQHEAVYELVDYEEIL
jgi:hypothetical protein